MSKDYGNEIERLKYVFWLKFEKNVYAYKLHSMEINTNFPKEFYWNKIKEEKEIN